MRNTGSDVSRINESSDKQVNKEPLDLDADQFTNSLEAYRNHAKECLVISRSIQTFTYNQGRVPLEFDVGDLVLINLKGLRILEGESGLGKKLNQRYDGPFEVIEKVSPVAFRLRLESSYRMHNVVNIAYLEPYATSPDRFGSRIRREKLRMEAAEQEWEIDSIVAEKTRSRNKRKEKLYRVRYTGYGPEQDEWLPRSYLRNAPEILQQWENRHKGR